MKFINPLLDDSNRNISLIPGCPVCRKQYNFDKLEVLSENNLNSLIYIKCHNCQSAVLARVGINPRGGIISVGLLTDLSSEEVMRFKNGSGVGADEVLEIHDLLYEREDELIHNLLKDN